MLQVVKSDWNICELVNGLDQILITGMAQKLQLRNA